MILLMQPQRITDACTKGSVISKKSFILQSQQKIELKVEEALSGSEPVCISGR